MNLKHRVRSALRWRVIVGETSSRASSPATALVAYSLGPVNSNKEATMQSTNQGSKAPVAIWPDGPPRPLAPYTPAIKAAGWLFISGQLASDFKGGLAPEAASANPNLGNALELQSRYTLANLAKDGTGGRLRYGQRRRQNLAVVYVAIPNDGGVQSRHYLAAHFDHAISRHAKRVHSRTAAGLDRNGHPRIACERHDRRGRSHLH